MRTNPFPYLIMDEAISIETVRTINREWPEDSGWNLHQHDHSNKRGNQSWGSFGPVTAATIERFNGLDFLAELEAMTGIKGLVADRALAGGGLHETFPGGFLGIHADFNYHPGTKMHRRLNLLVFLNESWQDDWQGHLELWKTDKSACVHKIAPIAGRAVLFATTDNSFHGHPEPLACPQGVSRRSLALYYYTPERPESEISREHSTIYL